MLNFFARIICSFKDWAYGSYNSEAVKCLLVGGAYIIFLIWFTHVDIIHNWLTASDEDNVSLADAFISKHARFLTMFTNWGLLFMLYLDLLIAHRTNHNKAVIALSVFGVLALMFSFGCAAGDVLDDAATKALGVFNNPTLSMLSLLIFCIILCYLKYIALKPQEE